jgi:hypothetical protein
MVLRWRPPHSFLFKLPRLFLHSLHHTTTSLSTMHCITLLFIIASTLVSDIPAANAVAPAGAWLCPSQCSQSISVLRQDLQQGRTICFVHTYCPSGPCQTYWRCRPSRYEYLIWLTLFYSQTLSGDDNVIHRADDLVEDRAG